MSSIIHDLNYVVLAREQATRSNCSRRHVGAVVVKDNAVLVSASNGTPVVCTPCNQGGCARCQSDTISGEDYDSSVCIHAEQRAIALAASRRASTNGATMYVTLRPCLPCLNLCLHAGITTVIYDEEIAFARSVEQVYAEFVAKTQVSLRRIGDWGA